ncbi:MAG: hypothetical protein JWO72_1000 [Caulobacteraceae bacterium]|nr:hypothetical protein [Caulobacteraceae bacterium]
MPKTFFLTAAAVLALGVAPAFAQPSRPATQPGAGQASSAAQAGGPTAAAVAVPAVGVVVDAKAGTAVVVPVNPRTDVPPDVTVALKALSAAGKVKPGQIVQIVLQDGNQVTEVITNAPVP